MVGELDEITRPSHGYKFIAAMQRAQGCANPVLLKTVRGGRHGPGTTPEQAADTLAEQLDLLIRLLDLDVSLSAATRAPNRGVPDGAF
jgi:prolyl oligopeptidase